MSAPAPAPEVSGTRQRINKLEKSAEEEKNPASLSANPSKKVARNKASVKPPFIDMSMNKFLTYLVLSLFLILGFYIWRFVAWAHQVGGYWAVITGNHKTPVSYAAEQAASAAASVASVNSAATPASSVNPKSIQAKPSSTPEESIESQIFHLAAALGIKPAELSGAIRPLVDPSVPNPADHALHQAEMLKQQVEAKAAEHEQKAKETEGSVLGILGEALLD